jgi:pimeloyl-ACP methyl ester carboxylesterase
MIREFLTILDVGALFTDPVFYGMRVPHGDGKPVVLIPGLFGNDCYLQPLRQWLGRVGYSPMRSTIEFNAGCIQRLREEIQHKIVRHLEGDSRPIALIGHSRGGVLAWALAGQLQERVSHLVMLGSPVASFMVSVESGRATMPVGQVSRMLMRASTMVRHLLDPDCNYPTCGCPFLTDVMRPLSPRTAALSVYGRDDLMVPEEAQRIDGQTLEVSTSHVGLVFSPEVYRALGQFLATSAVLPAAPSRSGLKLIRTGAL